MPVKPEKITDMSLLKEIVFDDAEEYSVVHSEDGDHGRWSYYITTVFRRKSDGKLFMAHWSRPLTENSGEIEYPDEAVEVREVVKTITVKEYEVVT